MPNIPGGSNIPSGYFFEQNICKSVMIPLHLLKYFVHTRLKLWNTIKIIKSQGSSAVFVIIQTYEQPALFGGTLRIWAKTTFFPSRSVFQDGGKYSPLRRSGSIFQQRSSHSKKMTHFCGTNTTQEEHCFQIFVPKTPTSLSKNLRNGEQKT